MEGARYEADAGVVVGGKYGNKRIGSGMFGWEIFDE